MKQITLTLARLGFMRDSPSDFDDLIHTVHFDLLNLTRLFLGPLFFGPLCFGLLLFGPQLLVQTSEFAGQVRVLRLVIAKLLSTRIEMVNDKHKTNPRHQCCELTAL